MSELRTSTKILASAMRKLSREIQSEDGVAEAAISEAAGRLEELQRYEEFYSSVLCLYAEGIELMTREGIFQSVKKELQKVRDCNKV